MESGHNLFLSAKAALTALCGAFTVAFGWVGWLVLAWIVCMAGDYATGSMAACKQGRWSSKLARDGIWHKAGMVVVVAVAALADGVLGMMLHSVPVKMPINYTVLILPIVLIWYILTELGSVLENATLMSNNVPKFLVRILAVAKDAER